MQTTSPPSHTHPHLSRWAFIALLLLSYGLLVSSSLQKSATVDEQSHLFRGTAYLKANATHFLWGHPLLASSFNALPLLTEPDLQLPQDDPAWHSEQWWTAADAFLWLRNASPLRLLFLGRLPTMWLTLLVGAMLYRWGRELGGRKMALLAAALWLLDPNVLAHGQLITSDVALTLCFVLTLYGTWRYAQSGSFGAPLLLAGFGLGMAGATKFNAAALLPIFGLLLAGVAVRQRRWQPLAFGLGAGVIALGVIAAVYRFNLAPLWADLAWQFDYFARPHGAYLLGEYHVGGRWLYFPVAFAVKTSLPVLALLLAATSRSLKDLTQGRKGAGSAGDFLGQTSSASFASLRLCVKKRIQSQFVRPSTPFLWLPILIYTLISLSTPLNIGYRHLLPLLPFLYLWLAQQGAGWLHGRLIPPFIALLLFINLLAWPNYLPYFNRLVGQNGWHILSDSNLDWGQDLPALAEWQAQNPSQPLFLSYFGMSRPSAYKVRFTPLPTWSPAPEQGDPARQPFYPPDPAPGVYAISVTNLQGVVLGTNPATYAYFRPLEPLARLGGSIFLYEVAPRGRATHLALSGLVPADLPADWHALWQTNNVQIRWFNAATSLIWPAGQEGWLATAETAETAAPLLQPFWPATPSAQANGYTLTQFAPPALPFSAAEAVPMGESLTFLGQMHLQTDDIYQIVTGWRVEQATTRPLKLFIHLLNADGQIISQWDGLDVAPHSWQAGDIFLQAHTLPLNEETAVQLRLGAYDGETQTRLGEVLLQP